MESLHLLAIVYRSDIKCLRDLNASHLGLLENILINGVIILMYFLIRNNYN